MADGSDDGRWYLSEGYGNGSANGSGNGSGNGNDYDSGSSQQRVPFPASSSPSTRSAAPTAVISSFLARGAKLFIKSSQPSKSPTHQQPLELSSSSSPPRQPAPRSRLRNVSGPSHLRPILPATNGGIYSQPNHHAARSVVELAQGHRSNNDTPPLPAQHGTGDLRALSSKAWAHSADDLGTMLHASNNEEISPNSLNLEPHSGRQEIPRDGTRKPSLNLRIEAYRNNLGQFAQQPSPSYARDIPSPARSTTSSPMNQRFPTPSHDKTCFVMSSSDSSPVVGSTFPTHTTHSRSNSYNVLGTTNNAPSQEQFPSRHKTTGSGNIPSFSFPFGGGAKPQTPARPKEAQISDNRRASQVVHCSGFLNRNVSTSFPMNLNKNWKAYKAEIKGSKLYLYKPPSERSNGVRDLFPTEWGPQSLEEVEQCSPGGQNQSDSSGSRAEPRRKRLFWGPGRHPEAVVDERGVLVAGTIESLIYELVFAESFSNDQEWQTFSQVVLLTLPALVGEGKFEIDLSIVIDRYIRYAGENSAQGRRTRMEWLLSVYARFYYPRGLPSNLDVFANSLNLRVAVQPVPPVPSFHLPNPPLASPKSSTEHPDLHRGPSSSYSGELLSSAQSTSLGDLRYKGTMTRERMMGIDVNVLAQSLELFFIKEVVTARQEVEATPVLSSVERDGWPWSPFSPKDRRPHWLTHFIVVQIVSRSDGTVTVSSTHSRAAALSKWIRVAEHARQAGNECAWKAIAKALTSKPVARLEKAWRRVDSTDRQNVDSWLKGDRIARRPDNVLVPWLSKEARHLKAAVQRLKVQSVLDIAAMEEAHEILRSVHDRWGACTAEGFVIDHSDVIDIFRLWEVVSTRDPTHLKPLDEYVPESLQAEPVQFGRLAQYFHQPRSQNYHLHALVPFTFPEPLPSLAFLDRSELVRLRKESMDKHGNTTSHELQMEHLTRLKFFPSEHVRSHWTSKEGIELDDTIFRLFEGEMIVKVVKDTQPSSRPASFFDNGATSLSRRPSRAPSIRVTPHAASTLERKSSNTRRQSMPLLNNGRSRATPSGEGKPKTSMELLVPVVIVGGTIERLVDVLVRGLDYVMAATADDNGEMALTDRRAKGLKLDRDDYSKTWWSTYRSFLTPEVLIAMLRKQFRTTVPSPKNARHSDQSHDVSADANLRMAILTVVSEWLIDGGGVMDVLDQPELYTEVWNWLEDENEHAIPPSVTQDGVDYPAWQEVEEARRTLLMLFETQTKRPLLRHLSTYDSGAYGSSIRSYGAQLPDPDRMSPQELVEQLDAIGAVGVRGLQAEDLVSCMEILEIQSKDKTGWIYLTDLPTLSQDEMIIQNIYHHLTLVEPSPMLSDFPPAQRLTSLAQPSIRAMLYCFDEARKWATAVLAQPGITVDSRCRRIELFLQALDMSRTLSSKTDGVAPGNPVIRSFVETVLSTAILSPESRMFQRAWYQVAIQRRLNSVDTLEAFLRPLQEDELPFSQGFKLAVDFGWMIERLLEMISMPDVLVNTTETLGTVINFEKRRHLYTFVLNMPTLATSRPSKQRSQLNNVDLVRLHNMYEWAARILTDGNGNIGVSQIIKDEAFRENTNIPQGGQPRKYPKPFSKIVLLQQEKNKRDRHIRDRLLREKRMEQHKREKQNVPYEKAMDVSKKSKQGKRASMNPFMRVVRPLSTAFPFGGAPAPAQDGGETKKWTLEELDFMPTSKPSVSIDLAGARVEERKNNARPFIFTLETEDGIKYYFQATTHREMCKWVSQLAKTGKSTSEKRRTYVGVQANLNDFYGAPKNLGRHPTAVFAVPLEYLLEREYGSIQPGTIPSFLERCLEEVETRGFTEDGIYRISGSKLQIDRLKAETNTGRRVNLHDQDIHNVCSLVKLWIREIPGGLMPGESFWLAIEAVQTNEHSQAIQMMQYAISRLPLAHFNVLRRVLEHLTVGSTHEDQTRMAEKQFSLVFGQTILTPPESGGIRAINAGIQYGNRVVEVMLNHYHAIFEGEGDAEDDDEEEVATEGTGGEMHFLEGLEEEDEEQSS